jgi:mannose-1-phosphate guanylyltransferase
MLARVPLIPPSGLEPDARSRVWTIVLTGDAPPSPRHGPRAPRCRPGDGRRLGVPPPRRAHPVVERAGRLAPAGQVIAVLTRARSASWERELAAVPQARRVVQPVYRGRAAELLLPLLRVARQDPSATVVVLPGEGRIDHDARFLRHVARAVWAVALRPDVPILVGAHPDTPVADGWIEPGPLVEGLEDLDVRVVRCFVDGVSPAERRRLFDDGALTSTSIFVGRAGTLRALAERVLPDVLEALEPLQDAFDRPEETLLCEAVYECMPRVGLDPLERAPGLAVLALPDVVSRAPDRDTPELLAS